jgi:hypothetical protein
MHTEILDLSKQTNGPVFRAGAKAAETFADGFPFLSAPPSQALLLVEKPRILLPFFHEQIHPFPL